MKTQVIQLDAHDDFISVRDKMSWTKSPRILLVFPDRARILNRTLDLLLLKRHAIMLGAQLAVVTRSEEIRDLCKEHALPIFPTSASAQRDVWGEAQVVQPPVRRAPRPELRQIREFLQPRLPRWQSSFAFRFSFFTLGFLAVATLLLLFLPSAAIELTPETITQSLTITVQSGFETAAVNGAGNSATSLQPVFVNGRQTIEASGTMTVPDGYAAGSVHFENLTDGAVDIPAGTVVRSLTDPPARFATLEDASLPVGIPSGVVDEPGSDVPVLALEAGPGGNVPAGAITAIEGGLGASLSVTNPLALSGGTKTSAPVATANDRATLRQSLLESLSGECLLDILAVLPPGAVDLPDVLAVEVLDEGTFPEEGQPGGILTLTMEVECVGKYTGTETLQAGFRPLGGITIVDHSEVTFVDGAAQWEITAERLLRAEIDPLTAVQLSLGHRPGTAVMVLEENLPLAAKPVIHLTPAWWPWLPAIPFQITILEPGP